MKNNISMGHGRVILHNRIKCNHCGDIIESYDVHDFKYCKCQKVFVDGGHEYLRRGFTTSPDDFTDMTESVAINSHGVNANIKYNILSSDEMRRNGFELNDDIETPTWSASFSLKQHKKYDNTFKLSLNISLPLDSSKDDLDIVVMNEEWGQPYDYQYILSLPKKKKNHIASAVKEEVEDIIAKLQEANILNGHERDDYI